MDEYPSNSTKRPSDVPKKAPDKPRLEPVVTGELSRRKKPMGKRFADNFLSGETPRAAGSHVFSEVIVPAIQAMMVGAGEELLQRVIVGEGRRGVGRTVGNAALGHFNYQSRFQRNAPKDPRGGLSAPTPAALSRKARATFDFEQIVIPSRVEAEAVISDLFEQLANFEVATVSDLYELLGISAEFTEEKFGWTDLRGSRAVRIPSGGYVLDLPRPIPLVG